MPDQSGSDADDTKTKRRGGGGKLSRTETVTVRLDPKLRYLAELAARKQRRTLSSFIEWAIEEILKTVQFSEDGVDSSAPNVASEAEKLWDVDEPDRFAKLALSHADMLTHDEQVLWKLIRENGHVWKGHFDNRTDRWMWEVQQSNLIFERLRDCWAAFKMVAYGDADRATLPNWIKEKRKHISESPPKSDLDDEIPF
jgi:hypothetical protein